MSLGLLKIKLKTEMIYWSSMLNPFYGKNNEKIRGLKEELSEIEKESAKLESKLNELKGTLYTNSEAIIKYEHLLKTLDDSILNVLDNDIEGEEIRKKFSSYINDIEKELKILKAGKRAEKGAIDSLKLWRNDICYLSNIRFIYDDVDVEEDLIVITSTGIFSIEIKNWKKSAKLNSNGILVSKSEKGERIDIVNQVKRHCFCLHKILDEANILSIPKDREFIYPIILWQHELSELKDEFHKIPICCANTLEDEVFDYSKYPKCFTDEDINKIYNILDSKREEERKYPLVIPDEFIDLFLSIIREGVNRDSKRTRRRLEQDIDKIEHPFKSRIRELGVITVILTVIVGTILEGD